MQIKKERKQTYRYSYTQLAVIKPAKAPGQDSIGTGGQNSIGANKHSYELTYLIHLTQLIFFDPEHSSDLIFFDLFFYIHFCFPFFALMRETSIFI